MSRKRGGGFGGSGGTTQVEARKRNVEKIKIAKAVQTNKKKKKRQTNRVLKEKLGVIMEKGRR